LLREKGGVRRGTKKASWAGNAHIGGIELGEIIDTLLAFE
jgi:hypothetical protein